MEQCRVIAITNQKGGVGKTTTTVNLGVGLAKQGKRVLLIDADPQGSLTISLGERNPDQLSETLSDVMECIINDKSLPENFGLLRSSEGVDLMPANIELSGTEVGLFNVMSREYVLKSYIDSVSKNYDYILIDCMPSLGMMTINALAAADRVIIPSQPSFLSTKGLNQLMHSVAKVKRQINPRLNIDGILLTMVDNRTNNAKAISTALRAAVSDRVRVFDTQIPFSVRAAESAQEGQSIFAYDKGGKVAAAYEAVTKEVLEHESKEEDIDLDLTGFAELFMNDEGRAESRLPRIYDIPLSEIDDFPNHPFKVKMDEDMNQLVQSVKERGIITPVTLRQKEDGRYEIVSGHRRRKACELAGLERVPAEIKELSRDEAIILMVESNLQRSIILPSEKAFSYKMRLEAMKRQGQRTDLTSTPVVSKSRSNEELAEQIGESREQVRRYIRLTELIPELLDMVDENKIAFRPAVELSYLTETEQHNLLNSISYNDATPSLPQAIRLKEFSKAGKLSAEVIEAILGEEKPNQKEKISFKAERLRPYIPSTVPLEKTEDYIIKALEYYQRARERQKREQAR